MVRLALAALLLVAASCQRLSVEECDTICWRFNELQFWERVEAQSAQLPPDGRERLRAEKQKEWEAMKKREFDPGRENCVKECRRAARPEDVECVKKAASSQAAQACLK